MICSRVERENPVVRQTRTPIARSAPSAVSAPGSARDLTARHRGVEGHLEPTVRFVRPRLVAFEHRGEHLDLRLTHGAAHVGEVRSQVRPVGIEPHPGQRLDERGFDDTTVADRGAGHVEHGEADHESSSSVCSATAGDSVIPRPPRPGDDDDAGIGTDPHARAVVGRLRVDAGPAALHRRDGPTEERLRPREQVRGRRFVDGEVVRLVVVVGVADGELTRASLRDQELGPVLGDHRCRGRERGRRREIERRVVAQRIAVGERGR